MVEHYNWIIFVGTLENQEFLKFILKRKLIFQNDLFMNEFILGKVEVEILRGGGRLVGVPAGDPN